MGSAKNRREREQKQRERKARKRSASADGVTAPPGDTEDAAPPDPSLAKMSDVLLDFAAPLVEGLGRDPSEQELQGVLFFAAGVWNFLGELTAETDPATAIEAFVDDKAKAARVEREEIAELVEKLVRRKAENYPDDRRLVRDIKTQRRGGKINVTAAYEVR